MTRATDGPSDASPEPPEARIVATMRLREALDMERATSQGNAMTPLGVAGFIGGPWLDYIAEPYLDAERTPHPVAASAAELREALWEELRFVKGATDEVINRVADRLAAAPPRASEPAEAAIVTLAAEWEARVNRRVGRSLVAIEDDLAEAVQRASR